MQRTLHCSQVDVVRMRADHRRMVEEMRTAFDEADKAKEAAFAELEDKMRHDPSRQSLAETLPKAIQAWHSCVLSQ